MIFSSNKVLAISSPGGHWIQLNKICNPLELKHEVIYASPRSQYQLKKTNGRKVFNILDASADNKLTLIPLAVQLFFILLKERPKVIISTGAAPGVIAILLGKVLRIKTVWIDSIANVQQLSRSARIIKSHANVVVTQWQPLSDNKTIFYRGSVL